MKEKEIIAAILGEELIDFLKSINMYDSLSEGKLTCCKCNRQIDENNLLIIFPRSQNNFEFLCDDPTCLESFDKEEAF